MATYCISFVDEVVSLIEGADAYCLEGPLTTFFRTRNGSAVIDSWSARLASFRTASIASVQRLTDDTNDGGAVQLVASEVTGRRTVSVTGVA